MLQTLNYNIKKIVSFKKQKNYFPSFIYIIDGYNITRTAISYIKNINSDNNSQEQLKSKIDS